MRGKVRPPNVAPAFVGITPAHAGKSLIESCGSTGKKDHPRVCGEKCGVAEYFLDHLGSPPHVRGKGIQQGDCWVAVGITPAYAGKRESRQQDRTTIWDHPRTCGEKENAEAMRVQFQGSPPRMRGKGGGASHIVAVLGITPAHAGKSGQQPSARPCRRDHPRVCGEKVRAYVKIWNEWGSPPHVRGKAFPFVLPASNSGITPACAGKSS